MRVILDTNVLVSGVFFSGPPSRILEAWRDGDLSLVLSAEILEEYWRVGEILGEKYPGVDLDPFLAFLAVEAEVVEAPPLPQPVSRDADDDKFLACALAAGVDIVVSGDRHLLEVSGWEGVEVLPPRRFVDERLGNT